MMNLQDITRKLADATTALAKADKDLKLEMAGAAADAAGLIDPTPASDIVGAGISIARGDYWGAALSTVSMVPYLGDALAKPAKAVRATRAIMGLEKKVAELTKTVADLKKAKKQAEAAEAAAKEAKIAKEAEAAKDAVAQQEKAAAKKGKDCEDCKVESPSKFKNKTENSEKPLLLGYTPTTDTLSQIRNLRGPERWQRAERYVQELYGSPGQRHFTVPQTKVEGKNIAGTGGRFVDAPVPKSDGGILANEVKTYQSWTTINGQAIKKTVPLTEDIEQQILKDVWLRENVQGYDPRWIFLDAGPSTELSKSLSEKNIIHIIHK